MPEATNHTVHITVTIEQAQAMCQALELYSRIGIGQFEDVAYLVRAGFVPMFNSGATGKPERANAERCEWVASMCDGIKTALQYPVTGSHGIGHKHVSTSVHRAYEMRKVIEQALAMHRDPNPSFRGVNYDGLVVRYTSDPAPVAKVCE